MINIGAYKKGSNQAIDMAVAKKNQIDTFLCQGVNEKFSPQEIFDKMKEIMTA
jgi:flagellum-specific ATP synthase